MDVEEYIRGGKLTVLGRHEAVHLAEGGGRERVAGGGHRRGSGSVNGEEGGLRGDAVLQVRGALLFAATLGAAAHLRAHAQQPHHAEQCHLVVRAGTHDDADDGGQHIALNSTLLVGPASHL